MMRNVTGFTIVFILIIALNVVLSKNLKLDLLSENEYVVLNTNVNLREEPNGKSRILRQLKITTKVILLKRSGTREKIGDYDGEWVYVDIGTYNEEQTDTIKGWLLDYFLSDGTDFEQVTSFNECIFNHVIGDLGLSYKFFKDGTYKRAAPNKRGELVSLNGRLYRKRNVVIACDNPVQNVDGAAPANWTFFLNADGILCINYRDEKGNKVCAKCK